MDHGARYDYRMTPSAALLLCMFSQRWKGTMRIDSLSAVAAVGFAMLLAQGVAAAEVKVSSVVPLKTSLDQLGPAFERATGHKLMIKYAGSSELIRQLDGGEAFDVALVWPAMIDKLIKQGQVAAGSRADIARVAVGVAVRKGAPKPDISTADALKRTLLNAKSISHSTEGASGTYFKSLLERLGIAADMQPKLRPVEGGPLVVGPVARGEVEMAVITIPFIFADPGAELVGPLPKELQHYVVYTAGVSAAAKQPEAAKALIEHLTTPAAASVIKSKGLEPATP
jgi:molybdate transport system substrate-binding protein